MLGLLSENNHPDIFASQVEIRCGRFFNGFATEFGKCSGMVRAFVNVATAALSKCATFIGYFSIFAALHSALLDLGHS